MAGNDHLAPVREVRALTGLRGIAALWVVSLHYTLGAGWSDEGFWFAVAAVGNEGVIVFFLLSGYILNLVYAGIAARRPISSYGAFLWARFARIYPLHVATLVIWGDLIALGFLKSSPADRPSTFLQNLFLVQAWGFVDDLSWNRPAWTISVELFWYLLFPFIAFALARRSVLFCFAVLCASLACVAFVPYDALLRILGLARGNLSYGFFVAHFGGLFVAGMALYRVTDWMRSIVQQQLLFDFYLLVGLWIVFANAHPPVFDWTIAVGASFVIVGCSRDKGLGGLLFGNPVVFFLGEISYALYLTHGMFRVVFQHYFPHVSMPVMAAFAILFAVPVYYLLERPARSALRRLPGRLAGGAVMSPGSVKPSFK